MKNPTSILITGASSGIGAALAKNYAQKGITIFINGRNNDRLTETANLCREKGAEVYAQVVDITEAQAVESWITKCETIKPLDLIIANAGISGGTGGKGEPEDQIRKIIATNIDGVVNTVLPAIKIFRKKQHGQIALISSIAGYRGLPSAPAYSSSKAFVRAWGAALKGELRKDNIEVSVICPGFIESRITAANNFKMPFFMKAETAANIITKGLENNKICIAFPWQMVFPMWLLSALPLALSDKIVSKLPAKPRKTE